MMESAARLIVVVAAVVVAVVVAVVDVFCFGLIIISGKNQHGIVNN